MARTRSGAPRTRRHNTVTALYEDDIAALRARKLGYRAIAEAVTYFRGMPITENQVEGCLGRMGEAPSPNMSRASRLTGVVDDRKAA